MGNRRDKKTQKPKPMAGGIRIQQLCPAQKDWKVLLLELDDDNQPIEVKEKHSAKYFKHNLVDIAFWALLVEEDQHNRYQEMLPCVPTVEGTMEPVDPEDPAFIAVITPAEKNSVIAKMVDDYVLALPEMLDEEEGGDDDQE
jgi:hypothetical protein